MIHRGLGLVRDSFRNSSGSLALFAAIPRASSRVSKCAAARDDGLSEKLLFSLRFPLTEAASLVLWKTVGKLDYIRDARRTREK
jgi:hypothetical protein